MADYAQMSHEELAAASTPLTAIINKDTKILGYMPTDDQIVAAQAEYDQLNEAARLQNQFNPHAAYAAGPELGKIPDEEVKLILDHRMAKRRAEQGG